MDLGLQGKSALVTGSTAGIGQSIALHLAAEGADVAICGRNSEGVEAMLDRLRDYPVSSTGKAVDIGDGAAFSSWVEAVAADLDGIDILVANVNSPPLVEDDIEAPDSMATIRCIRSVLPWLRQSDAGSIVYISSIAGVLGLPSRLAAYGAGKAALTHYMKSLAQELIGDGIRVNTVAPGDILFEGGAWDRVKQNNPELYAEVLKRNIRGSLGTPEEIARVVTFLASPASSLVNGTHLIVDGCSTPHVHF